MCLVHLELVCWVNWTIRLVKANIGLIFEDTNRGLQVAFWPVEHRHSVDQSLPRPERLSFQVDRLKRHGLTFEQENLKEAERDDAHYALHAPFPLWTHQHQIASFQSKYLERLVEYPCLALEKESQHYQFGTRQEENIYKPGFPVSIQWVSERSIRSSIWLLSEPDGFWESRWCWVSSQTGGGFITSLRLMAATVNFFVLPTVWDRWAIFNQHAMC